LPAAGPKSGREFGRFGRTEERYAKITGNCDAIWISMAGINLLTTAVMVMRDIVTADGILIVGAGIATGGIGTEMTGDAVHNWT
jgi:hypothetical protein